jgi:preprotein translocase subunit SecD
MSRSACALVVALSLGGQALAEEKKLPDGVYAVLREGLKEKDVLPLKDGEALAVHRHRYLKDAEKEPPRYLVVRRAPDVLLDLAAEPKAEKEGEEVVRILLKLRPKAAAALERLTRDQLGRQVAIVVGGEVVTAHKVRTVIKSGDAQISSCTPGAAGHLLKQLRSRRPGQ